MIRRCGVPVESAHWAPRMAPEQKARGGPEAGGVPPQTWRTEARDCLESARHPTCTRQEAPDKYSYFVLYIVLVLTGRSAQPRTS